MSFNTSSIYMGFWTDRAEENVIVRPKLTVSSELAKFLAAFMVMYVTFAASKLWDITAYGIHFMRQGRITARCRPVLRQQQVTLKNSVSPGTTAHRLLKIWWASRYVPTSLKDSCLLIMFALLCGVGCLAAGLYSNKVVDLSPEVQALLNSPNCGFVDRAHIFSPHNNMSMTATQYYLDSLAVATSYTRTCYNTTSTLDCGPFTEPAIDWETEWDSECPFDDAMCIGPAMKLDTGNINSNKVLGLNSEVENQIALRKVTTCAPVTQDGFVTVVDPGHSTSTIVKSIPGDKILMNTYGPSRGNVGNYTWGVSNYTASTTPTRTTHMESYFNGQFANFSSFQPIPELRNSTGDGTLSFVSNNAVSFVEPCDDPVFSSHMPYYDAKDNLTYYLGDHATGVIGCLEQYQWCDPTTKACTPIASLGDSLDQVSQVLNPTGMQNATVHMLGLILNSLANIPFLGSDTTQNLMANQKVNGQVQFPLPSNQWQIEVQAWHGIVMKLLQEGILRWVIGPSDPILQEYRVHPASPEEAELCRLLRVQPGPGAGVANVSTFGFFFVMTVGTAVILIDLFTDSIAALLGRFSKTVRMKQQAWIDDDALQLQRMVYEEDARVQEDETGHGPGIVWTGRDSDVPVAQGNDVLLGPLRGARNVSEATQIGTSEEHATTEETATETEDDYVTADNDATDDERTLFEERAKAPERRLSI